MHFHRSLLPIFEFKYENLSFNEIKTIYHESIILSLVVMHQKTHSFSALSRSFFLFFIFMYRKWKIKIDRIFHGIVSISFFFVREISRETLTDQP